MCRFWVRWRDAVQGALSRRVASHTSEEQRRNAPGSAAKNGILAFSASLNEQHGFAYSA